MEETEHKAVAFDLYEYLYGNGLGAYLPRVAVFTFSLLLISNLTVIYTVVLMKRDKQLLNIRSWKKFGSFFLKNFVEFAPKFASYYSPSFHPNDVNHDALVAATRQKIGL